MTDFGNGPIEHDSRLEARCHWVTADRLRAVAGAGSQIDAPLTDGSSITVNVLGRDAESRVVFGWAVFDAAGLLLAAAADLRSGCGDEPDPSAGLVSLLSFLTAFAEALSYDSSWGPSENADLFGPELAGWALEHSDELSMLELELRERSELARLLELEEPSGAERMRIAELSDWLGQS